MTDEALQVTEVESRVKGIIGSSEFQDRFFELVSEQDEWSTENGKEIVDTLESEFLTENDAFPTEEISGTQIGDLVYTVFRRETFRWYTSGMLAEIENELDNPEELGSFFGWY